jgi:predicted nucleic acid-binding protein
MIHLDTNFLIRSLIPGSSEGARMELWIRNQIPLHVSALCWAEFLCGPLNPSDVPLLEQILGEPIPFTRLDAEKAAELFNASGRRRGKLMDCMIAATALREGAAVATSNVTDFARLQIAGLRLEKP